MKFLISKIEEETMAGIRVKDNEMIIANNVYYDMDCYKTKLNNNVLVVGTSGSGKTRSIVSPNILQAYGSYVISDPKGNLYEKYGIYLSNKGYKVRCVNFAQPEKSVGYNPLEYIQKEQDIVKIAHLIVGKIGEHADPFWDRAAELLLTAVIGLVWEKYHDGNSDKMNLVSVTKLLLKCNVEENLSELTNHLDEVFNSYGEFNQNSFAVRQYSKFRIAAGKTLKSILISVFAKIGTLDTAQIRIILKRDETDLYSVGKEKTALFVVVSDTDRSMDSLANIFFSQTMQVLCSCADKMPDSRLPVDTRFILDDFATNGVIYDFPRMISSIRSRGISTMLMIQSEGQIEKSYGMDYKTIISNCDTYVYLGSNDVETAKSISLRADVPLKKVLNMPVQSCWVFRRGEEPVNTVQFDLDKYDDLFRQDYVSLRVI